MSDFAARPSTISVKALLFLILLAFLGYVLFLREDGPKKKDEPRSYKRKAPSALRLDRHAIADEEGVAPPISTVDSTDTAAMLTASPAPTLDDELHSARTSLSRIPLSSTPPAPKVLKKDGIPSMNNPSKRVLFVDKLSSPKPLHSSHRDDDLMGAGKEEIGYTRKTPLNQILSEDPHGYVRELREASVEQGLWSIGIHEGILFMLLKIEHMASQDGRGNRDIRQVSTDPQGRPYLGSNNQAIMEDPTKDAWDTIHGPIPKLALDACKLLADSMSEEDVTKVHQVIEMTPRSRNWAAFLQRATGDEQNRAHLSKTRLAVGWFAETYRCIEARKRVSMRGLPEAAAMYANEIDAQRAVACLRWLEALASHFIRQRAFSQFGLDLDGMACRLKVPAQIKQGVIANSTPRHEYSLELEIFMWGGPTAEGSDPVAAWLQRLKRGHTSFLQARKELVYSMEIFGEPETDIVSSCTSRRVLFRPGWTVAGVHESYTRSPRKSSRIPVLKDARVVMFKDATVESLNDEAVYYLSKLVSIAQPREAVLYNVRQFHLDTNTVTAENNVLSEAELFTALWALGPGVDNEKDDILDRQFHQELITLNFGSYLPLLAVTASNGQQQVRFFPLEDFLSLEEIVVPFIDKATLIRRGTLEGDIGQLLLNPQYGLQPLLEAKKVRRGKGVTEVPLRVFFAVPDASAHLSVRLHITNAIYEAASAYAKARLPDDSETAAVRIVRKEARQRVGGWAAKHLNSLYTIDTSSYSGNINKVDIGTLDVWPPALQDP